jgi:hypothetical protein
MLLLLMQQKSAMATRLQASGSIRSNVVLHPFMYVYDIYNASDACTCDAVV